MIEYRKEKKKYVAYYLNNYFYINCFVFYKL